MSRKNTSNEYRISQWLIAAVYLLLVGLLSVAASAAETDGRTSTSRHYADGGRSGTAPTTESRDVFGSLEKEGIRRETSAASGKAGGDATTSGKTGGTVASAQSASDDFWIYSADVILFGDDDNDGHFYGIDLLFDADTIWNRADVYAVLYLSYEGGPWNEYAVTEDFLLTGASSDDEYVVVTELESGYPRGSYDVLIELFDAVTGEYLAGVGPAENPDLGFLPLEDFVRDDPQFDRPVVVNRGGGGGSFGPALLLFGLATALVRRRTARVFRQARSAGPGRREPSS